MGILVLTPSSCLFSHESASSVDEDALASRSRPSILIEDLRHRLEEHCFACHGDGAEEGGLNFEKLVHGDYGDRTIDRWEAIWKNIRSQTMPPTDEEQPEMEARNRWTDWITDEVFRLSADAIDPGKVVLRRLNRTEYRETISLLTDVNFDVNENFPADDTGYGFDTIGEVLQMSPVLVEKYLAAAESIVEKAIPLDGPSAPEKRFWTNSFRDGSPDGKQGHQAALIDDASFHFVEQFDAPGRYRVSIDWVLDNAWSTTNQAATVELRVHGEGDEMRTLDTAELGFIHGGNGTLAGEIEVKERNGVHHPVHLSIAMRVHNNDATAALAEQKQPVRYTFRLEYLDVVGPLQGDQLAYRTGQKILFNGPPPRDANEDQLDAMTREVFERFTLRAFRRTPPAKVVDRLVEIARQTRNEEGKRYEHGIAMASKLVLASPRFLFRVEDTITDEQYRGSMTPENLSRFPTTSLGQPIDEFALASRLSFMLWGAPPDDRLLELAKNRQLRDSLDAELDRMIGDEWRLRRGVENFVGQWLQVRDVMDKPIDTRRVLAYRDNDFDFNWQIRSAMKQETETMFRFLIEEDRPATELLNADYSFLNRHSAKFYGIEGVDGDQIRKVDLPAGSHRRGVLTHGSVLLVTSNPTRTSPVKRGLFVLENLLGYPAPPAPPNVPSLEDSQTGDLEHASLREVLERHRRDPACASCHQRMDPLGLAMEHFNALGQYREMELGMPEHRGRPATPDQTIDAAGELMTGESFQSIEELAEILANERRDDFYRCLAEKMLVYSLGRGLTYRDTITVDQIVNDLQENGGKMRTLIDSTVRSIPFNYARASDR